MPAPIRSDHSNKEPIDNSFTSITSPIRRIQSFIDDEEDANEVKSPSRVGNNSSLKSSPNGTVNKRKRNHPPHPHENNFGQLNRTHDNECKEFDSPEGEEGQKKRLVNYESPGSPLRKKPAKQQNQIYQQQFNSIPSSSSSSWGSRLRKYRPILDEHRQNNDFEAWSRDLWQLGNWWLEVTGEEAAGIVFDLVDEFKREQAQSKGLIMIPTVCSDLLLDKLQAKALALLGKGEQALEVCQLAFKDSVTSSNDFDSAKIEIKFLEGCLSRALGKISGAIEAFQQVLKLDPNHAETHDHLYGATCGLLPYRSRNEDDDALVQAYNRTDYRRVIELSLETLWTRWLGDESVLVLLASSLACKFDSGALYSLGQRSVNQRPEASVSWYCVGLFYQVTGRTDEARRYLFKAGIGSKIKRSGAPDPGIGPAWIALGHSFAAYGDHDQAVSAYVAAVRTHCPGSVDPSLFLAIEYLRVRQPVLAAAYLLDAHAANSGDPRVLNELACLQAGKSNFPAAKKLLDRAFKLSCTTLPPAFRIVFALNLCVVHVKELMVSEIELENVKMTLKHCVEDILGPLLDTVKRTIGSTGLNYNPPGISPMSLFPWTANSAHPSAEHGVIFTFCVIQEWRALLNSSEPELAIRFTEDALEAYRLLLECRNEHRNLALESVLIERQHRLLSAHSTISTKKIEVYQVPLKEDKPSNNCNTIFNNYNAFLKTPRTPLIRSHSLSMMDSFSSSSNSNLSYISAAQHTPIMSFSAGALPTASTLGGLGSAASSIAASVSRRRLSLRRQMTGLRFDPADTSASFSSLESDNSFTSATGTALVTSTQINEDLMMTSSLIANQSMILTDIEADCEFAEKSEIDDGGIEDEDDMRLDSD